jgi:ribulose-phosphate 3-epimerase
MEVMAEIIPAILEKEFAEIEKKIRLVEGLVSWVQIDILDSTLMNNVTFSDPAPFSSLRTPIKLELHLMVKDPLIYLPGFAKAGFKRFFAHIEGEHVEEYIETCLKYDVEVGLAIDGLTPVEKIKKYLADIDSVLVMAVSAGQSGGIFREETLEKIKKIKEFDFEMPISVDGAMNVENAKKVVAAGATRICSNSYIFGSENVKVAIGELKSLK